MSSKVRLFVGLCLLAGISFWLAHRIGFLLQDSSASPQSVHAAPATSISSTSSGISKAVKPQLASQTASPISNSTSATSDIDATSTFIGFRYDNTHVLFRAGEEATDFELTEPQMEAVKELGKPVAEYDQGPVREPSADVLAEHRDLFDRARTGEQWQLEISAGSRIPVIVQKPIIGDAGCSVFAGFLAEVAPANQKEFAASAKQYFLIHRGLVSSRSKPSGIGALPDWKATPELRSQIERLLDEKMLAELPRIHSESALGYDRAGAIDERRKAWGAEWKQFDEKLARGEGKLEFDTQAFQLSPDGIPRLFVRARWTIDQKPAFLLALWLRAGPTLVAESIDAREAGVMRMSESIDADLGLADLGTILNVFNPNSDGHGALLIFEPGYEGYNIQLYRYTDAGPVPTKVSHGAGC